jgi:copper transport protein
VVLVLTGMFASWRQVGFDLDGYAHTSYGNILLSKLAIFAGLIALAAISRFIVRKRRAAPLDAPDSVIAAIDERTVENLRQSVGGEVSFAVALLLVTALLVQAVPARSAVQSKLFSTEIDAGQGKTAMVVDVTVDPARTGLNALHIYLFTPQGADLAAREVTAEMVPPDGGEPTAVTLVQAGDSHFVAETLVLSGAGTWKLVMHIRLGEFDDTVATTNVPIR